MQRSASATGLALIACGLGACSGESDPPPAGFEQVHTDAFLVVHVDVDALRAAPAFQRFVTVPEVAEEWAEMQRKFAQQVGFAMTDLRALTFSGFTSADAQPGVLIALDGGAAADAARVGRPQVVERGEYGADRISATIPEDGEYWLRVEAWNDVDFTRTAFSGELSGQGALGARFAACALDALADLRGPLHAVKGERLELEARGQKRTTLTLLRSETPLRIAEHDVYRDGMNGFVCRLSGGLVLIGDDLLSWNSEPGDVDPWERAVRDVLEPHAQDTDLRATLAGLGSKRTARAAFVWSELPREMREMLAQGLVMLLGERHAAALHELETIGCEAQLDGGLALRAVVRCEDEEGAEEVLDLLEDLLDLAEALRDVPPALEDIVEAIELDQQGSLIRVALDADEGALERLFTELERQGR